MTKTSPYDSSTDDKFFFADGERQLHKYTSIMRDYFADKHNAKRKNVEIHFTFSPRPCIAIYVDDIYGESYSLLEALEEVSTWSRYDEWMEAYPNLIDLD